jgi:hypothetical protein
MNILAYTFKKKSLSKTVNKANAEVIGSGKLVYHSKILEIVFPEKKGKKIVLVGARLEINNFIMFFK